ncbi:MAG TPA: ABC transporter ATP-binding protein [Vicinamibacterales bacterium]|nr:ABC transporter ATP-binding protein [Vicinamibacterales bacterium]
MSDVVIRAERLSKRYRLGEGPQGQGDFRDAVSDAVRRITRRLRRRETPGTDGDRDLWALHDVSFEVKQGEVVGLIGQNGAGKSTLLKILSRITDPTSGRAWYRGRVGSLLEVGTGFHPELSGRENVYLSGAILGMTRREIDAKFDEIVAFSEMERFLDTPVKRYSSGMYVRLGFAVAAHLDPEVLIIDEVLAVGDAGFQRKCLAKMKAAAREGRTILFVSHNMGSIQRMCSRALVLRNGRLIAEGAPLDAVKTYLKTVADQRELDLAHRTDRRGRGRTRMVSASIYTVGHEDAAGLLVYGRPARVRFELSEWVPHLACRFTIYSQLSGPVCRLTSTAHAPVDRIGTPREFICELPELTLAPGQYRLNAAILSGSVLEDHVESTVTFDVEHGSLDGRSLTPHQAQGVFVPRHRWIVPDPGC